MILIVLNQRVFYFLFSFFYSEKEHPEIYKRFPLAFIFMVPDAGHWVHSDRPKEFLEIVTKFIM